MKFVISSSVLLKQLAALNGVIVSNPVVPILENFLFEIDNNTLTITASDLQMSVTAEIPVEAQEKGSIAIPAKMLSETLRNLPEQPVTFLVNPDSYVIEIVSENGHYKLAGENATDFPKVSELKSPQTVDISSEVLSSAIAYTLFAVSTDEMKPAMGGVFINIEPGQATFVATDSHRLVRYRRYDLSTEDVTSIILPRKAMLLLKSNLPSEAVPLRLAFNASNAFITFENIRMTCRLVDERFPDYEYVIPSANDKLLEIDRQLLLSSLRRIAIYANKSTNQVRMRVTSNQLTVSAEDIDFSNEANETLPCYFDQDEFEIGFNAKFLMESLSNIHAEKVHLKFSEPNRAGLMLPAQNLDNEDVLMLIMPVMLASYY
jgi:DNA polymerase-3 subunit beta